MKKLLLIAAAAFALTAISLYLGLVVSGGGQPKIWIVKHHKALTACADIDCGPYSTNIKWSNVSISGLTDYQIWKDGSQVDDVPSSVTSYTYVGADCGKSHIFGVKAHGTGGTSQLYSTTWTSPACNTPAVTTLPVVTDVTLANDWNVGDVLSTSTGTWTGSPTFVYKWEDCNIFGGACSVIVGANSNTYTLQAGDVGSTIISNVYAINGNGTVPASSAPTGLVTSVGGSSPTNLVQPTFVSGTSIQGQLLTTSNGTWSNSPTSYTYQWQRCTYPSYNQISCSNIGGATSSSYTSVVGDANDALRVAITATNAAGSATANTPASGTVATTQVTQKSCFPSPGTCGYPDPNYTSGTEQVGVPPGTSLTTVGTIAVSAGGCTPSGPWCTSGTVTTTGPDGGASATGWIINGVSSGQIVITTSNVEVENSQIALSGGGSGYECGNGPASSDISVNANSLNNLLFLNDTLTNATDGTTVQHAVYSMPTTGVANTNVEGNGIYVKSQTDPATAGTTYTHLGNGVGGCAVTSLGVCPAGGGATSVQETGGVDSIWWGPGLIENSNETIGSFITCDHLEFVFEFGGPAVVLQHNTSFNPIDQTSGSLFVDNTNDTDNATITDNLVAGGGFAYYPAKTITHGGTATVTNNRIARCSYPGVGNYRIYWTQIGSEWICTDATSGSVGTGTPLPSLTTDGHGYYAKGGSLGVQGGSPTGGETSSGNIWDDTAGTDTWGP